MKLWKWAALAVSGGMVFALGGCASNIRSLLVDIALPQIISALTGGLTGTTT